ncbi:MAG: hypothetical protein LC723_14610, partial [Actinobacteria bacterium]|nr:hypothetical protein [Actinomycetota bacterium]
NGTPQQVKQLLAGVIDSIDVESKALIQPYYFLPGVRVVFPQRRRTIHNSNRIFAASGVFVGDSSHLE